jgi:transcriptional regulator with GAF, ATPase, and Fis domain
VLHGADRDRPGAFESAAGGTFFLDEVGECDLETLAKLLRVRPSPSGAGSGFRTIRRVGDQREIPVAVRVIAATNRDLDETISAGTFREDLFDRLSVCSITWPPLRERRSDSPHITDSAAAD